jgi:uncharacterized membrane protein HdeD (DUF308 family)
MNAVGVQSEQTQWWGYLLSGIVSILMGWLILSRPVGTILTLVVLVGFYLLIGGIVSIVSSFMAIGEKGSLWGWKLLAGLFSVIVGLIVLNNPLFTTVLTPVMFMYIVAFALVINGIVDMAVGRRASSGEHIWSWGGFALGALYLVFGLTLLGAPTYYATETVVSIAGWALIFIGLLNAVFSFVAKGEQ